MLTFVCPQIIASPEPVVVQADASGEWSVEGLPPGRYEATLRGWMLFFDRQADLLKGRHDTDLKARHDDSR